MKQYSRRLKLFIVAFIGFHWLCVLVALLPTSPLTQRLAELRIFPQRERAACEEPLTWSFFGARGVHYYKSYMWLTRQTQNWRMFARPARENRYVSGEIEFSDGTTQEYVFPRLSQLNTFHAVLEKRYRKIVENLFNYPNEEFFSDVARYMARKVASPTHTPLRVVLMGHTSQIPEPDSEEVNGLWPLDFSKRLREDATYSNLVWLDYPVLPGDLGEQK